MQFLRTDLERWKEFRLFSSLGTWSEEEVLGLEEVLGSCEILLGNLDYALALPKEELDQGSEDTDQDPCVCAVIAYRLRIDR